MIVFILKHEWKYLFKLQLAFNSLRQYGYSILDDSKEYKIRVEYSKLRLKEHTCRILILLTGDNYNIERNDYGGPKENEVTIYLVPNFKMEISSGLWAINPERSESALPSSYD